MWRFSEGNPKLRVQAAVTSTTSGKQITFKNKQETRNRGQYIPQRVIRLEEMTVEGRSHGECGKIF